MKKKISLLAAVLILVLGLAGCSSKSETSYDAATLKEQADAIIGSFSQMSDEDFKSFKEMSDLQLNLTLMQSGFKMDASDFVTMIDAWNAGIDECGAYVSHDDFKIEESADSIMLVADAKYKKRDAEITVEFNQDQEMKSFTASAEYTTGEILKKAGLNTVLGMGTVFVVLIFISFIISLFGLIGKSQEKKAKALKASEAAAEAELKTIMEDDTVEEDVTDDLELVAVISAAIAASEGTSTDGFVVRSIKKRRKNSQWK